MTIFEGRISEIEAEELAHSLRTALLSAVTTGMHVRVVHCTHATPLSSEESWLDGVTWKLEFGDCRKSEKLAPFASKLHPNYSSRFIVSW